MGFSLKKIKASLIEYLEVMSGGSSFPTKPGWRSDDSPALAPTAEPRTTSVGAWDIRREVRRAIALMSCLERNDMAGFRILLSEDSGASLSLLVASLSALASSLNSYAGVTGMPREVLVDGMILALTEMMESV